MGAVRFAAAVSVVWFASGFSRAQRLEDMDRGPIGSVAMTEDRHIARVRLTILDAPSAEDRIFVAAPIDKLQVTLITPDGRKITATNALASGFKWDQEKDFHYPGGMENPGSDTTITFARPGAAGQYIVEVTAASVRAKGRITASFSRTTPTMNDYRIFLQSLPGAQMRGPVPISPTARLKFEVSREEPLAVIDAVVPDSSVEVLLELPDGRVLSRNRTQNDRVGWSTAKCGGALPEPELDSFARASMIPLDGCHHIIQIQAAAQGTYEIRASWAGKTSGRLRAAFVPLRAMFDPSAPPLAGQVRIRRQSSPYECFTGDEFDLKVALLGEHGSNPPEFKVRIEERVEGTVIPAPIKTLPLRFVRGADGDYHARLPLSQVGFASIEVGVTGKNEAGQPYNDRAIFQAHVSPVVARIVSLEANPVDSDGDRKFDRFDLSANLDVVVPGEYNINFSVTDARQRKINAGARAILQVGRQSLTARIDGWRMWNDLRDGPYEVHVTQLFLQPGPLATARLVGGVERVSRVVINPREDWDHGPTYGEDRVSFHGIDPVPSGRFRLAEAEWEVTGPGGHCEWGGDLFYDGGTRLYAGRASELAPGTQKVSLFFDGSDIAAAGPHEWKLEAGFSCEGVPAHAALVGLPVDVNSSLYEAAPMKPFLSGTDRLSGTRHGFWSFRLYGHAEGGVRLGLSGVPQELDARITNVFENTPDISATLTIAVRPGSAPGRYFLAVNAQSGNDTTTREVALDISPLDVVPIPK